MGRGKPKKEDENSWRSRIEETPLDEETWTVKVIVFEAAGSEQDMLYLNKFESIAGEDRRFVIKNICKTETIFMINQLGSEKKVKDENFRVFEEGQVYLKNKKEIPPDVLAVIIKHLILKMKEEYLFIRRQKLEVKDGLTRESATMLDQTEVRGIKPRFVEPPSPPATSSKGKKGKSEPDSAALPVELVEGKKYNTILRERGEEWRDRIYVDDYPTDGPNLYVAISGFMDSELPVCLARIGIPLVAVIQIRIDVDNAKIVPSALIKAYKRGHSQTEILAVKLMRFWDEIQEMRISPDTADDLKNTAFIIFRPPYWSEDSLSGSGEKIYDELSFLMYDVQDLCRQHNHFLENVDVIEVPDGNADETNDANYHQQMDEIPLECVTIYSILDSMLLTVSKNENAEGSTISTANTMNQSLIDKPKTKVGKAEAFVNDLFTTLCKTEVDKKKYRITYGEEYENYKTPPVLNYGDFVKLNTFHLGNINLDNVIKSIAGYMPWHKLWLNQPPLDDESEIKVSFHVNVLLSCFSREDVEVAEFNRLMNILACRKLYTNRSSLKKEHLPTRNVSEFKRIYLKRSIFAEPLFKTHSLETFNNTSPSFPSMTKSNSEVGTGSATGVTEEESRIQYLFDCPDISELVSAAEIANQEPMSHMIDDFEFFEDFSGIRSFQILLEAFNEFNCIDYKYDEVTDTINMMFYNSRDKHGISREEWRCHLLTPLCLQDFFDFVLEEKYDWIQNEETIYEQSQDIKKLSEANNITDIFTTVNCTDETDVGVDLLMEGSLKEQTRQEAIQETDSIIDTDKTIYSKKTMSSKGSINSKTNRGKTWESKTSKLIVSSEEPVIEKPFVGYDLGDRRLEVFGKDATFFSKDGTRISTYYTLSIPSNSEYITLNVATGFHDNEFWFYKTLGNTVPTEIASICESILINAKGKVSISLKKHYYQAIMPRPSIPVAPSKIKKTQNLEEPEELGPLYETKYFYSFYITWPNGLVTESVYDSDCCEISHIKQTYLTDTQKHGEDIRCITLNGEVIIFKTDGEILIYQPDGTYFKITKYEKKPILSRRSPDSEHNVEKPKNKNKAKDKAKERKNSPVSEEEKPLGYELFIEKYESFDISGLRQSWVKEYRGKETSSILEQFVIRTATNYGLGETFSRRIDGTFMLFNQDGVLVVTFPDKTRIITTCVVEEEEYFVEWTEEEKELFEILDLELTEDVAQSEKSMKSYQSSSAGSRIVEEEVKQKDRNDGFVSIQLIYTIEHINFATVTIDKYNGQITIDSPDKTSLTVNSANHYDIKLDNCTNATFDGDDLHITYEACSKCKGYTICDIAVENKERNIGSNEDVTSNAWAKIKDSFSKNVVVDYEGNINVVENIESHSQDLMNTPQEEVVPEGEEEKEKSLQEADNQSSKVDWKSESSVASHGNCREIYQAKNVRYIVLHRDLTCSELVPRALIDQYRRNCEWKPWCFIDTYDTFGDYRNIQSILMPINLTETERWRMESSLSNKPKTLTYKDLKRDSGKGWYHWMRPYERYAPQPVLPEPVPTQRLPRAYILRTLEQQWKEDKRDQLKGAKELIYAILQYRQLMETEADKIINIPVIDLRDDDERATDKAIQRLGHKLYQDMKSMMDEAVHENKKADITTKPPPIYDEEILMEGEYEEEIDSEKRMAEEREMVVKEVEEASPPDPNLQRYWRRRAEEKKEEDFYLCLLREGGVPPYFQNILGGAIWWEVNNTAENAVTKSERTKMTCKCAEEGTSAQEGSFAAPTFSDP